MLRKETMYGLMSSYELPVHRFSVCSTTFRLHHAKVLGQVAAGEAGVLGSQQDSPGGACTRF